MVMARLHSAQRISIVGPGGAGKTTLARQLGRILELPIIHLDRRYYARGWQGMNEEAWGDLQRSLTRGERWIMEGNYAKPLEPRLWAADRVIFLDLPSSICAARAIERWWGSLWVQPVDLPAGMRHRVNRKALWYGVQRGHWPIPPSLRRFLEEQPERVETCRSIADVRRLLQSLSGSPQGNRPVIG